MRVALVAQPTLNVTGLSLSSSKFGNKSVTVLVTKAVTVITIGVRMARRKRLRWLR